MRRLAFLVVFLSVATIASAQPLSTDGYSGLIRLLLKQEPKVLSADVIVMVLKSTQLTKSAGSIVYYITGYFHAPTKTIIGLAFIKEIWTLSENEWTIDRWRATELDGDGNLDEFTCYIIKEDLDGRVLNLTDSICDETVITEEVRKMIISMGIEKIKL